MKVLILIAARLLLAYSEETIIETRCSIPTEPNYGSRIIVGGEPIVGSIVTYSCEPGRKLIGSATTKCLSTGKWTFPTPECLESCYIPEVPNGEIGKYERRWRENTVFRKYEVGTEVENEEKLVLRCARKYEPLAKPVRYQEISCLYGVWSENPICEPAPCRRTPPRVRNATLISIQRHHGGSVVYLCNSYLSRVNVTCNFGSWQSPVLNCRDTRCYTSNLNFPGTVSSETHVYYDSESFSPTCSPGYQLSSSNSTITCNEGRWEGHLPPCIPASCELQPPVLLHGRVKQFKRYHGALAKYECDAFYVLKEGGNVKCLFGQWNGKMPICSDTRCYLKDLRYSIAVSSDSPNITLSGEYLDVKCEEGYRPSRRRRARCFEGKWIENRASPCEEKECIITDVSHGFLASRYEGPAQFDIRRFMYVREVTYRKLSPGMMIPHNGRAHLVCIEGYSVEGKGAESKLPIICKQGEWSPDVECWKKPPCYLKKLVTIIPEGVAPREDYIRNETVLPGTVLELVCNNNDMLLDGDSTATCGKDGLWKVGKVQCVSGCSPMAKAPDSKLIVHPEKDFYRFGDIITLSCLPGHKLSSEMERVICLENGWFEEVIPDCVSV